MVKPWIWSDMCRERVTEKSLLKKTFKMTAFQRASSNRLHTHC